LVLSVDTTDRVDARSREPIVNLIESSAKTRGDIGALFVTSNSARYDDSNARPTRSPLHPGQPS
jgi:hypothetical protein